MKILAAVMGLISLLVGLVAAANCRSDIQVILLICGIMFAITLFMLSHLTSLAEHQHKWQQLQEQAAKVRDQQLTWLVAIVSAQQHIPPAAFQPQPVPVAVHAPSPQAVARKEPIPVPPPNPKRPVR